MPHSESDAPPALPALAERWARGWATSRRAPEPGVLDRALRVELGLPGRDFEVIVLDADPSAIAAAASEVRDSPGAGWVTVVSATPERAAAALADAGLPPDGSEDRLMTTGLATHPEPAVPSPYRLHVTEQSGVLIATVTDPLGAVAASARAALRGADAVPDKVETAREHRRRGLGAAVMGALAAESRARGARTGVLAASVEGERLYTRLGWEPRARLVIARPAP